MVPGLWRVSAFLPEPCVTCLCLHSSPVHARAPSCRSGSVLIPQFSHIPVYAGLGRECSPASATGWLKFSPRRCMSGGCRRQLSPASWEVSTHSTAACESQVLSCYYSFLTMTAVGSLHLFHKNKSASG